MTPIYEQIDKLAFHLEFMVYCLSSGREVWGSGVGQREGTNGRACSTAHQSEGDLVVVHAAEQRQVLLERVHLEHAVVP